MAIVKMKHLHLLAMREDRDELLRKLQRMGCVEIDEPSTGLGENDGVTPGEGSRSQLLRQVMEQEGIELTAPDSEALSQAQTRQQQARHALAVLGHCGVKNRGFLTPRPQLTEAELYQSQDCVNDDLVVRQILEQDHKLAVLEAQESKLLSQRAVLAPWLPLQTPLDLQSTQDMVVQFGTLPATVSLEQVTRETEAAGELVALQWSSTDQNAHYVLLACHKSVEEPVLEVLREAGWSRVALRDWTGTAQENDQKLKEELEELAKQREEVQQELMSMVSLANQVQRAADRASVDVNRETAKARLLDTQQTFYLQGWVPARRQEKLEQILSAYPCAWEVSDPTEEEYPQVPVRLENNWLTRPLNMVTEMYSLPAYNGIDPNPLMAPFFILFYGIMMADMGYGLLMMLASVVVLKKARPRPGMHNFFALLGLCGISTFLMGALTGGFFGDFIPKLIQVNHPESTFALPALISPTDNMVTILAGSLVLGIIQIFTGMAVSFVYKLKHGEVASALTQELAWWAIFACIGGAVVTGHTMEFGIAIGVIFVVTQGYGAKNPIQWLVALGGSLYNNITGYFSDILSYARLMALMLSGAVVAQAFNTLGMVTGNVFGFVVMALIGNTLNFALNLLGCYVHDLRLQCLEYFNRFFVDGGREFRPMEMETEYYDIVDETY